jgi:hypothetical protein
VKKIIWFIFYVVVLVLPEQVFATINFNIANPTVSVNDEIEIEASISGLTSSSCSSGGCYLQAEIRILDETKGFFGFTYNNSEEYIDYFSSPSSTDEIKSKLFNFIPTSGAWSGKLKAKNNSKDSNYVGPGQYGIKFRRFSGNSLSATSTDSNQLTVLLSLLSPTVTPTVTPVPAPTDTPCPTRTPTPTKIPVPTIVLTGNTLTPSKTVVPTKVVLGKNTLKLSSVSSTISPTRKPDKRNEENRNIPGVILIITGSAFLIGCAILGYLFYRKRNIKINEQ